MSQPSPRSSVSVLVPSYKRHESLARCLAALERQTCPAEQVIVVHRVGDSPTAAVLEEWRDRLSLTVVEVTEPGVVAAMNAGLQAARAAFVAITDDDAAPRPDWLERVEPYFDDPSVGGVGGRDLIWHDGTDGPVGEPVVGRLQWFGRVIGNHHLGVGPPRDVDVLKGVNCAYRRNVLAAVGFDRRLRGSGVQMHWELSLGLTLRREGWRLVYDPAILVDHFEEARADGKRVSDPLVAGAAMFDDAYNKSLVVLDHLPPVRRRAFHLWAELIGTRASPGWVQALRFVPTHGSVAIRRRRAAAAGRAAARRDWRRPAPAQSLAGPSSGEQPS